MSSLATLKTKLRSYLKCDPNDKIWNETQKDDYLNNAYFQIQKDGNFDWPENQADLYSFVTTGGTETYAMPTNFMRLDLVQLVNGSNDMGTTTKRDVVRRGLTSNGQPSQYYIWGNLMGFYPIPDTGYTVKVLYKKRLPTMTSEVDSAFPTDFDDPIVRYAAYQIWSTTKNTSKAAQALQDYEIGLKRVKMGYLVQDARDFNFGYQKYRGSNNSWPRRLSF